MIPLTIKDIYNKTSLEAWNLLRLQLLQKMKFIAEGGATATSPTGGWILDRPYLDFDSNHDFSIKIFGGENPIQFFAPRDEGGFWGIYRNEL